LRIYDVTVPIKENMPVWPGQPRVEIEPLSCIDRGDQANESRLNLGSHTGTHVDAPYHFVEQGLTVDKLPLDLLVGPAFVAEVDGLDGNRIDVYDLASLHFPRDTTRLLIKTSNSQFWEDGLIEFEREYVHLDPKTAKWLVGRGIHLLGIDYLSVEAYGERDFRVHHTLLEAGVVIVEGLNLSRVPAGPCQLLCLPLKVEGIDGAPARVVVVRD
jgi:arylformamidase